MPPSFSQTQADLDSDVLVETPEESLLDAASEGKLLRLAVQSLLFVLVCVFIKLPLIPLVVLGYFLLIKVRYQLQASDLLVLWLVAVPFLGPYITIHVGGGIPDITFRRLFVLLLLFTAFSGWEGRGIRLLSNGLDYALVLFVGAGFLSMFGSIMIRTPLRVFLDALLIPCAYYFTGKRCASRPGFMPKLFVAGVLALLALGAIGTYEGISGHDVLHWEGANTHMAGTSDWRVNGPWATAEAYGTVMVMLLLFVSLHKDVYKTQLLRKRYVRLAILAGVVAVACTLTRGIWLALLAGWLVFYLRRSPKLTLSIAGFTVVLWLVLQQGILPQLFGGLWHQRIDQTKTIYSRLATYKSALAMFEDYPVTGVGFDTFSEMWDRFPRYRFEYNGERSVDTPHNLFLSILAETGLVGFGAFLLLQIQVFAKASRVIRSARESLAAHNAEVMVAIAVAFLVVSLDLDFAYNADLVNKLYYLFLGVLSGLADKPRWEAPIQQSDNRREITIA